MLKLLILLALLLTSCITDGEFGPVAWAPEQATCSEKYRYRKPGEAFDRINYRPVPCDGPGHRLEWRGW